MKKQDTVTFNFVVHRTQNKLPMAKLNNQNISWHFLLDALDDDKVTVLFHSVGE